MARKQVGNDKLPKAYSDGRYNKLEPQSRTSSWRSLSFNLSFFDFSRRERSLMLRLCRSVRSVLSLMLELDDVLRSILRENQFPVLP